MKPEVLARERAFGITNPIQWIFRIFARRNPRNVKDENGNPYFKMPERRDFLMTSKSLIWKTPRRVTVF